VATVRRDRTGGKAPSRGTRELEIISKEDENNQRKTKLRGGQLYVFRRGGLIDNLALSPWTNWCPHSIATWKNL